MTLLQGVETCIEEEFWNGEQCVQCNSTSCAIGHFRIACTNDTDSMCLPCSGNPSGANRSCSCPAGQYLGFRRPSKCMSRRSVFIEELGPFSYKQHLQSCAATSILQHSTTFCLESSSNLCFTGTQEMSVDGECFELPGLGRKEVFYVDQKVTWKEAELGCIHKGGQLASSFEDPVELLRAAPKFRVAWTGRNRRQSPFSPFNWGGVWGGLCEIVVTNGIRRVTEQADCTHFHGYLCEKDSVQCFDTAEMQCFSCTNVPFAGSHWHYTDDGMLTSACPAECDSGHGVNWGEHCSSRTRAAVGGVLGLIAIAATQMLILGAVMLNLVEARRCMLCSLRKPQCATTGLFRPCRNHCSSSNHSALLDEQLKCESCQFDLQTRPLRMCCPFQAVCEGVMKSDSEWLFPSIWTILQLALSRVQSPGPHRLIAAGSSLLVVAALFNGAVWGFVDVSEDLAAKAESLSFAWPLLNPFAFALSGNILFVNCLVCSSLVLAAVERRVCCSCANRKVQCSFCKLADLYETLGVPGASASCTLADARPPTRLCLERACISLLVGEPCLLPSPTQHASNSDDAIRCVPPACFLLAKRRDWDDSNEDCCWSLPVGLQLNALTGEITGTPQAITAGMKYVVNVVAFNPLGVCSVQMTLSVFERPTPPTNILYPSIVSVAGIAVQDFRVCDSCCRGSPGPHWYCNDCRTRRYVICDACHTMYVLYTFCGANNLPQWSW